MNIARLFTLALSVFFAMAAVILVSAGTALLWPGTVLDAIWSLRPDRQPLLMQWRGVAGPGFLALAIPMAPASYGAFLQRPWARWLAVAIFAANGAGDAAQLVLGRWLEGGIGVAVAAMLICVLCRWKSAFACGPNALARDSARL